MLDLTVSVDLLHSASAFYWGCAILFGILPIAALIYWLANRGTDKKSMNVAKVTSVVIMACLFVGLPILSAGIRAEGSTEDIEKYHVLRKRLLLDKVTNTKIQVKQVNNHKFLVQQDKRKVLNAEVYGKRADITAISDEGKAYLEVVNYVKKQQKQNQVIANIRITPSLSLTSGSYETPKSKFRVICYTDEKEQHRTGKATKVLKY